MQGKTVPHKGKRAAVWSFWQFSDTPLIPQASANAKCIVGLVKEGSWITGYKPSDETFVSKRDAVSMAKQGQIAGVGIAHRGDTEYLKLIPNGNENDNLGNLPSVSPEARA